MEKFKLTICNDPYTNESFRCNYNSMNSGWLAQSAWHAWVSIACRHFSRLIWDYSKSHNLGITWKLSTLGWNPAIIPYWIFSMRFQVTELRRSPGIHRTSVTSVSVYTNKVLRNHALRCRLRSQILGLCPHDQPGGLSISLRIHRKGCFDGTKTDKRYNRATEVALRKEGRRALKHFLFMMSFTYAWIWQSQYFVQYSRINTLHPLKNTLFTLYYSWTVSFVSQTLSMLTLFYKPVWAKITHFWWTY